MDKATDYNRHRTKACNTILLEMPGVDHAALFELPILSKGSSATSPYPI